MAREHMFAAWFIHSYLASQQQNKWLPYQHVRWFVGQLSGRLTDYLGSWLTCDLVISFREFRPNEEYIFVQMSNMKCMLSNMWKYMSLRSDTKRNACFHTHLAMNFTSCQTRRQRLGAQETHFLESRRSTQDNIYIYREREHIYIYIYIIALSHLLPCLRGSLARCHLLSTGVFQGGRGKFLAMFHRFVCYIFYMLIHVSI